MLFRCALERDGVVLAPRDLCDARESCGCVALAVFVVSPADDRAILALVGHAVAVDVGRETTRDVAGVWNAVEVAVEFAFAGITDAVRVAVRLGWIGDRWTGV